MCNESAWARATPRCGASLAEALTAGVLAWALLGGAPARAQSTVRIDSIAAAPGQHVVVPITAATERSLTLVSVDVLFDGSLCEQIENQVVERTGRTLVDPQEGGVRCPAEGRVSLVLSTLTGDAVLPQGDGAIAHWAFDVRPGAAGGTFPLSIVVEQFRDGPGTVPVSASAGDLLLESSAPTATPSPGGTPSVSPEPTNTAPAPTATASEPPQATTTPSPVATTSVTASPAATETPAIGRPGDANCDGNVNAADLPALVSRIGTGNADSCGGADANRDGEIDAADVPPAIRAIFGR